MPGEPEPYPPIEPYATGMLDVGNGQSVYWEASGNLDGRPAVALHGGPGSGSTPGRRRWFANRTTDATAAEVDDAERAQLWERHVAALPHVAEYPAKAGRVIPVIRITPANGG